MTIAFNETNGNNDDGDEKTHNSHRVLSVTDSWLFRVIPSSFAFMTEDGWLSAAVYKDATDYSMMGRQT